MHSEGAEPMYWSLKPTVLLCSRCRCTCSGSQQGPQTRGILREMIRIRDICDDNIGMLGGALTGVPEGAVAQAMVQSHQHIETCI